MDSNTRSRSDNLRDLSKAELHCHLDGSLPLPTLRALLGRADLTPDQVEAPPRCKDLAQYLEKFDWPLQALQTEAHLSRGAHDLLYAMAGDGVQYAEVRFAPLLHTTQGLRCEEVVESVLAGIRSAQSEGCATKAQLILCAMRHHTPQQNEVVLQTALTFRGSGVCAIDLAGDEAAYPLYAHAALFRAAHKENLPFTIHAGECGSVDNVRCAVELGAARLGHGIALMQDAALMKEVARRGIGVEMCPTSNLQTAAISDWASYPLMQFLRAGIKVCVNTDNRTVSATTLTQELELVQRTWTQEHVIEILTQNAFDLAFA